MRRARSWPIYAFSAWTVFVWIGRIGLGGSPLLAIPFVVLAALAAWRARPWVTVLAAYTVAVWAIRTPFILVHDHPVAFKVVHTVLATVSISLAVLAQRHVQRERQTATTAARL